MITKERDVGAFGTGPPENYLELPIERLRLDNEAYSLLKRASINTVQNIIETERGKGLLRIRNMGRKHYLAIQDALRDIGLTPDGSEMPREESPPKEPETSSEQEISVLPESKPSLEPAGIGRAGLKTVAFVDYEHWFIALKDQHKRRPNIQAWFDDLKKRGMLLEVTFFGDFSDSGGMRDEINNIRLFTNRIIETKNTNLYAKKDFTDFIMLDSIYQKVITSPEIEQIVLFTGDGHFSSVAAYLRNFCGKVVGVYGVDNTISSQLEATADWCARLPFDDERYMECREAILKNLKYAEEHTKSPMFRQTVRMVSDRYLLDDDLVEAELRRMIDEGIVYSVPARSRRDYTVILNILKVNWALAEEAMGGSPVEVKI